MTDKKMLPLLMTASVSTRGMKGACFSDAEREQMYLGALSFYIAELLNKDKSQCIVFAENSDWDLSAMKKKLPPYNEEQIEFVSIPSEMFDISKGKGYNELLLINKALEKSELIKKSKAFFKVTGRYPIYNIRYFLDKAGAYLLEKHGNMYCDIKDHSLYDILRLGWCGHSFECRLFGVSTAYYKKNIAPLYICCDDYDGNLLEGVLFDFVKSNWGAKRNSLWKRTSFRRYGRQHDRCCFFL